MAEGTSTFEGLSLPRLGEYEQVQQTAATDMVTLTGAASMSGDFLVCQDSTGGELFTISSSGAIATDVGLSLGTALAVTGSITGSIGATVTLASTGQVAGLNVNVTSTGAREAAGTTEAVGFGVLVTQASNTKINTAFAYTTTDSNVSEGSAARALIGQDGANGAPDYFLATAGTATNIFDGAIGDHGFIDASMSIVTFTSANPFVGVKCASGSVEFYLVGVQATGIS